MAGPNGVARAVPVARLTATPEGKVRDPVQGLATVRRGPRGGLDRLRGLVGTVAVDAWVRLATVALAPIVAVLSGQRVGTWLLVALAAYALPTTLAPSTGSFLTADIAVGAALMVGLGGRVLPVLAFLLLTAVRAGRHTGPAGGFAAGMALALTLGATLQATGGRDDVGLGGILAAALLFPLAGLTAGSLRKVIGVRAARDRVVLQEANRLLSALRSIADHLPGGLDVATVSAALVAEIRVVTNCRAVMVFVEEGGLLEPTATAGVDHGTARRVRLDELRAQAANSASAARFSTPQGLPPALRPAAGAARHWTVLALGPAEALAGVVLVGFEDLDAGRAARPRLASIAADAGIALDNARLFDGTQARAADTARRRLAGDLHDGVAQSLAHLRMELELRSLATDDERDEMARLARLARHTLQELRATISDLRKPLDGEIDIQLRRHIDRLISPAVPPIEFESYGRATVDPERAEQVLRVAQEALSNALRHARAQRITVTLERDTAALELVIEDDGVGLHGPSPEAGGGIGLRSMRERATLLGGSLDVRPRVGGGTVVHLRCPTATSGPNVSLGRAQ